MIADIYTYPKIVSLPNMLPCDGAAVSRSQYSLLFEKIGTKYGAGDGVTTFNVPNVKGKSIFGKGGAADFANLNSQGGAKTINLTHTHTPNSHSHASGTGSTGNPNSTQPDNSGSGAAIGNHTHSISAMTIGNQSANSMTTYTNATQAIQSKYFTAYFLIQAL